VAIFKYGVSRELVTPESLVALNSLEPLRYGQTPARESEPVKPVDIEAVRLTAKHLSPPLKAMVRIHAATGMRPSEICKMRPADIEKRPDDVWIYKPPKHKTTHRKKGRAIPLVGDAKLALSPFLDRDPQAYCFSPKESAQWYRDQHTAARKTPLSCGDKAGSNRVEKPKRQPGEKFTKDSYRQAIQRAAEKAKTERWFPYQLRHTAGAVIREALGVEAAQAILGHSRAEMTEHYAKLSLEKAISAAEAGPTIDVD
jgi:integrase